MSRRPTGARPPSAVSWEVGRTAGDISVVRTLNSPAVQLLLNEQGKEAARRLSDAIIRGDEKCLDWPHDAMELLIKYSDQSEQT